MSHLLKPIRVTATYSDPSPAVLEFEARIAPLVASDPRYGDHTNDRIAVDTPELVRIQGGLRLPASHSEHGLVIAARCQRVLVGGLITVDFIH